MFPPCPNTLTEVVGLPGGGIWLMVCADSIRSGSIGSKCSIKKLLNFRKILTKKYDLDKKSYF